MTTRRSNPTEGEGLFGRGDRNDPYSIPYILVVGGHFCAGKDSFYDVLLPRLQEMNQPVQKILNWKDREPRPDEIIGVDYRKIDSDEHFKQLLEDGNIAVPYPHSGRQYGLSRDFREALDQENIPIMITDAHGLSELISYLNAQKLPNRLVSFMLYTSESDAKHRLLFQRARSQEEVYEHMKVLLDEFGLYERHEGLFRHVFRNHTVEGQDVRDRMQHLTNRALDILNLEERLKLQDKAEFREGYVNYALSQLFDPYAVEEFKALMPGHNLPSVIPLNISQDVMKKYALENGLDVSVVQRAAEKEIIAATNYYGVLTLYFQSTLRVEEKQILADLIEKVTGLTHQYREDDLHPHSISKYGLAQISGGQEGLLDFLVSLSTYDGRRLQDLESHVHTLVFNGVLNNPSPVIIVPVSQRNAAEFLDNVGRNGR